MKAGIIPAVIPKSFEDILDAERKVRELVPIFQIDLVDGIFAKPASWPFIAELENKEEYVNMFLNEILLEFEVDLMVKDVEPWIQFLIDLGTQRFIFHFDAIKSEDEMLRYMGAVKESGKDVGIAVTINDNPRKLKNLIPYLDVIQCMGIKEVGKQGEPFTNEVYDLMDTIKTLYGEVRLSVDGGVNEKNIKKIMEYGANTVVIGSAIFHDGEVEKNIKKLQDL